MNLIAFADAFHALTGYRPFPWQEAMFECFTRNDIPATASIPTGLGKTSVIAIWLIALARHPEIMPRRLVYVVNRRTVVDQTTEEVKNYRANLARISPWYTSLGLSTLRGQFADNREWSADPSQPAVICGTVDMIGSRLLFSGYGTGYKSKPLHASFLGQDVLLVHDEAHLEPAFQCLVKGIEEEQRRCKEFRSFRVLELTATSRNGGMPFRLSEKDETVDEVKRRTRAAKLLSFHAIEDDKPKALASKMVELVMQWEDSKVPILIFARSVEAVELIVASLRKKYPHRVQQLTGTLRGKERDALVEDPIFRRFLPNASEGSETIFLVCTSAGEVGVNLSAHHLVCDLSTFESMAQRFGRVNRFGLYPDSQIQIVHSNQFDEKSDLDIRRQRTLTLLQQLNGDGSPQALNQLDASARQAAFAPEPTILPVTDILFDAWSLTTIRQPLPGRPPVEPYLHGISEAQPPETYVAWREEVEVICTDLLREMYKPEDLLDDYPLKPHELLRDTTDRIFKRLKELKQGLENPTLPVWIMAQDGSVQPTDLAKLLEAGKEALAYKTVLLPPSAGGLENGLLTSTSELADDVADDWYQDAEKKIRLRMRVWEEEKTPKGMRRIRTFDSRPEADDAEEESSKRYWYWFELIETAEEGRFTASTRYPLQAHLDDAGEIATRMADNLKLVEPLRSAIILAARGHDLGKNRRLWQRSIGNPTPEIPLAKSDRTMRPLERTSYRHEFGSLTDIQQLGEYRQLNPEMQDLVLHLIAAHHGRARPHFPADEAFDPDHPSTENLAIEVPRRFARLQRKYGRWGLAYLESLVRAVDILASRQAEEKGRNA